MKTQYEIHVVICDLEVDETGETVDVHDQNEHTELVGIRYQTSEEAERAVEEMIARAYGRGK